jgi:hypothetical protein
MQCEDVDWIQVGQDIDNWWAFVKTAMKLLVPYKSDIV